MMVDRLEMFAIGVVVFALIFTVIGYVADRIRDRRRMATVNEWLRFYDRVTIRVYVNKTEIMGPISLTDLAMIVRYGGYQGQPEMSILHIPSPGLVHPDFDITVEVPGAERF